MWLPHFANIEPARQISIEVGVTAQDYFILSQDLSKKDFLDPIGIKLTQNGKKIAGLSFIFSLRATCSGSHQLLILIVKKLLNIQTRLV